MILLDTNVLVYAVGREHPLQAPSLAVLAAARDRTRSVTTIDAAYLELLHVLARARTRARAAAAARELLQVLEPPIQATSAERDAAIDLFERHERLGSVDALLASVSLRPEVDALVTADRAFRDVPGVPVVDLAAPDLGRILA